MSSVGQASGSGVNPGQGSQMATPGALLPPSSGSTQSTSQMESGHQAGAAANNASLRRDLYRAGGEAKTELAARQAIKERADQLKDGGGGAGGVLDALSGKVLREQREVRQAALASAGRLEALKSAEGELDKTLRLEQRQTAHNQGGANARLRQEVESSGLNNSKAAEARLGKARLEAYGALHEELSLRLAGTVMDEARQNMEAIAEVPPMLRRQDLSDAEGAYHAAERQYQDLAAGKGQLSAYSAEQVDGAIGEMFLTHPELSEDPALPAFLTTEGALLKMQGNLRGRLDNPSGQAAALPGWQRDLATNDPVSLAMIQELGVTASPANDTERAVAKLDPVGFAIAKYARSTLPAQPGGIGQVLTEEETVRAVRPLIQAEMPLLARTDPQKFHKLKMVVAASSGIRAEWTAKEVSRLLSRQSAAEGVEQRAADHTMEKGRTAGEQAMQLVQRQMAVSGSPVSAQHVWDRVKAPMTDYIVSQASYIEQKYGGGFLANDARYGGAWLRGMSEHAPPQAANLLLDQAMQRLGAAPGRAMRGEEYLDALKMAVERAPDRAPEIAGKLMADAGTAMRADEIAAPLEDGSGHALGQAVIAEARGKGQEHRALHLEQLFKDNLEAVNRGLIAKRNGQAYDHFSTHPQDNAQKSLDALLATHETIFSNHHDWAGLDNSGRTQLLDRAVRAGGMPPLSAQEAGWFHRQIEELGGAQTKISFLTPLYASRRDGVALRPLLRLQGVNPENGAPQERLIDISLARHAAQGGHADWHYANFQDFQEDNPLDEDGALYLPKSNDGILRRGSGGHIEFEKVQAAVTTNWERVKTVGNVGAMVVGGGAAVAGLALAPFSGGVSLLGSGWGTGIAAAGATALGWGAVSTADQFMLMSRHGQEMDLSNPNARWLYLSAAGIALGGATTGYAVRAGGLASRAAASEATAAQLNRVRLAVGGDPIGNILKADAAQASAQAAELSRSAAAAGATAGKIGTASMAVGSVESTAEGVNLAQNYDDMSAEEATFSAMNVALGVLDVSSGMISHHQPHRFMREHYASQGADNVITTEGHAAAETGYSLPEGALELRSGAYGQATEIPALAETAAEPAAVSGEAATAKAGVPEQTATAEDKTATDPQAEQLRQRLRSGQPLFAMRNADRPASAAQTQAAALDATGAAPAPAGDETPPLTLGERAERGLPLFTMAERNPLPVTKELQDAAANHLQNSSQTSTDGTPAAMQMQAGAGMRSSSIPLDQDPENSPAMQAASRKQDGEETPPPSNVQQTNAASKRYAAIKTELGELLLDLNKLQELAVKKGDGTAISNIDEMAFWVDFTIKNFETPPSWGTSEDIKKLQTGIERIKNEMFHLEQKLKQETIAPPKPEGKDGGAESNMPTQNSSGKMLDEGENKNKLTRTEIIQKIEHLQRLLSSKRYEFVEKIIGSLGFNGDPSGDTNNNWWVHDDEYLDVDAREFYSLFYLYNMKKGDAVFDTPVDVEKLPRLSNVHSSPTGKAIISPIDKAAVGTLFTKDQVEILEKLRYSQEFSELSKIRNELNQILSKYFHGQYDPRLKEISVRNSTHPAAAIRHEALHLFKAKNIFTQEEWSILCKSATDNKWIEKHNLRERYTNIPEEKMLEEAIAHEFGEWKDEGVQEEFAILFRKIGAGEITKRLNDQISSDLPLIIDPALDKDAQEVAKRILPGDLTVLVIEDELPPATPSANSDTADASASKDRSSDAPRARLIASLIPTAIEPSLKSVKWSMWNMPALADKKLAAILDKELEKTFDGIIRKAAEQAAREAMEAHPNASRRSLQRLGELAGKKAAITAAYEFRETVFHPQNQWAQWNGDRAPHFDKTLESRMKAERGSLEPQAARYSPELPGFKADPDYNQQSARIVSEGRNQLVARLEANNPPSLAEFIKPLAEERFLIEASQYKDYDPDYLREHLIQGQPRAILHGTYEIELLKRSADKRTYKPYIPRLIDLYRQKSKDQQIFANDHYLYQTSLVTRTGQELKLTAFEFIPKNTFNLSTSHPVLKDAKLINTPVASIKPLMEDANYYFQKALQATDGKEVLTNLAEAQWRYYHAMPFERGSAAIGHWLNDIVMQAKGIDYLHLTRGVALDMEAFASSRAEYVANFEKFFAGLHSVAPSAEALQNTGKPKKNRDGEGGGGSAGGAGSAPGGSGAAKPANDSATAQRQYPNLIPPRLRNAGIANDREASPNSHATSRDVDETPPSSKIQLNDNLSARYASIKIELGEISQKLKELRELAEKNGNHSSLSDIDELTFWTGITVDNFTTTPGFGTIEDVVKLEAGIKSIKEQIADLELRVDSNIASPKKPGGNGNGGNGGTTPPPSGTASGPANAGGSDNTALNRTFSSADGQPLFSIGEALPVTEELINHIPDHIRFGREANRTGERSPLSLSEAGASGNGADRPNLQRQEDIRQAAPTDEEDGNGKPAIGEGQSSNANDGPTAHAQAGYLLPGIDFPIYRAIEGSNWKTATKEQWLGLLTSTDGMAKDYVRWSGISQWFDRQEGKIPKEHVLAYVRENNIHLSETVLSRKNQQIVDFTEHPTATYKDKLGNDIIEYHLDSGEKYHITSKDGKYISYYEGKKINTFADDETNPRNLTYNAARLEILTHFAERHSGTRFSKNKIAGGTDYKEWLIKPSHFEGIYTSSHMNDHEIVFMKTETRFSEDGQKILHIIDIQSDWAKLGKTQGYFDAKKLDYSPEQINTELHKSIAERSDTATNLQKQTEYLADKTNNLLGLNSQSEQAELVYTYFTDVWSGLGDAKETLSGLQKHLTRQQQSLLKNEILRSEEFKRFESLAKTYAELSSEIKGLRLIQLGLGVPDAPLKGNDVIELAFQRAFQHAKEKGYAGVSWSDSEQLNFMFQFQSTPNILYDETIPKLAEKYVKREGGSIGSASIIRGGDEAVNADIKLKQAISNHMDSDIVDDEASSTILNLDRTAQLINYGLPVKDALKLLTPAAQQAYDEAQPRTFKPNKILFLKQKDSGSSSPPGKSEAGDPNEASPPAKPAGAIASETPPPPHKDTLPSPANEEETLIQTPEAMEEELAEQRLQQLQQTSEYESYIIASKNMVIQENRLTRGRITRNDPLYTDAKRELAETTVAYIQKANELNVKLELPQGARADEIGGVESGVVRSAADKQQDPDISEESPLSTENPTEIASGPKAEETANTAPKPSSAQAANEGLSNIPPQTISLLDLTTWPPEDLAQLSPTQQTGLTPPQLNSLATEQLVALSLPDYLNEFPNAFSTAAGIENAVAETLILVIGDSDQLPKIFPELMQSKEYKDYLIKNINFNVYNHKIASGNIEYNNEDYANAQAELRGATSAIAQKISRLQQSLGISEESPLSTETASGQKAEVPANNAPKPSSTQAINEGLRSIPPQTIPLLDLTTWPPQDLAQLSLTQQTGLTRPQLNSLGTDKLMALSLPGYLSENPDALETATGIEKAMAMTLTPIMGDADDIAEIFPELIESKEYNDYLIGVINYRLQSHRIEIGKINDKHQDYLSAEEELRGATLALAQKISRLDSEHRIVQQRDDMPITERAPTFVSKQTPNLFALEGFTLREFANFTFDQRDAVTPEQGLNLSPQEKAALALLDGRDPTFGVKDIEQITDQDIRSVPPEKWRHSHPLVLASLKPEQYKALSFEQLAAIPKEHYEWLNDNQGLALTERYFAGLVHTPTRDIARILNAATTPLRPAQMPVILATLLSEVEAGRLRTFTEQDLADFTSAQQRWAFYETLDRKMMGLPAEEQIKLTDKDGLADNLQIRNLVKLAPIDLARIPPQEMAKTHPFLLRLLSDDQRDALTERQIQALPNEHFEWIYNIGDRATELENYMSHEQFRTYYLAYALRKGRGLVGADVGKLTGQDYADLIVKWRWLSAREQTLDSLKQAMFLSELTSQPINMPEIWPEASSLPLLEISDVVALTPDEFKNVPPEQLEPFGSELLSYLPKELLDVMTDAQWQAILQAGSGKKDN